MTELQFLHACAIVYIALSLERMVKTLFIVAHGDYGMLYGITPTLWQRVKVLWPFVFWIIVFIAIEFELFNGVSK